MIIIDLSFRFAVKNLILPAIHKLPIPGDAQKNKKQEVMIVGDAPEETNEVFSAHHLFSGAFLFLILIDECINCIFL